MGNIRRGTSGFWLIVRARYLAEMTKLWLMVAIVALVLSAVQCAKEDDVGHDTREFMQQESLHNLSFSANLQERQAGFLSMTGETEDEKPRKIVKAAILTAKQKSRVRKYLKNIFTTSVEGHHTCWHVGGSCGLYKCMTGGRSRKCGQIRRGPGKACRRTIGKVCCPCGQANKREYIKRALERLERHNSPIRGKVRFFKSLTQYKIAAASNAMALCVK